MICYKIKIELDKPIPKIINDRGRREYDEEIVDRISNAFSSIRTLQTGCL